MSDISECDTEFVDIKFIEEFQFRVLGDRLAFGK